MPIAPPRIRWPALIAIVALVLAMVLFRHGIARAATRIEARGDAMLAPSVPIAFGVTSISAPRGDERIYFFHGLRLSSGQWNAAPLNMIAARPNAQIVMVNLPFADPSFFADGGRAYCRAFLSWFDAMDRNLDAQGFRPRRKAVVGVSYGGLHAMLAARLPQIDAYAALSPVTKVDALDEFWWLNNENCQPSAALAGKRGIVTYSADDRRVDAHDIEQAIAVIRPTMVIATDGIGHATSAAQARAIARFIS